MRQAKRLPFSGLYLEFQGTQLQMADGSTRAITPEECACFEDAEEVEACLEHVDDGCRWKIDLSGIAGVSPVSSTIVLPCSVSRAPPGDRIGSGFWKVCWDRVAATAESRADY